MLTVKRAAERLNVSQWTIYDLVASGRLHCERGSGAGGARSAFAAENLKECATTTPRLATGAYRHLSI